MSEIFRSIAEFFSLWRHTKLLLWLMLIAIAFLSWKFYFQKNKDADNFLTAKVERGDIQNLVTATGILQPRNYVDVGAQVSGQLKKLYVEIGSQVKAGDLLAEIDATVFKARVDGIRAQLQNQQALLGDREAQVVLTRIKMERQENLSKEDATTVDALQTARAAHQSAQAQFKSLQSQINQTQYSLRVEEANLTYARIYAPMDGTVMTLNSRQGQTLNANQQAPTIMRIADLSTMTVQTQVSEADIGKLRLGMPVYFTTLGGQDFRWYSKLDRIEPTPTVTNNVVLYNALFEVPNESQMLRTQMSTQVFFIAARAKDVLLIPASALNFKPRKPGDTEMKSWGDRSWGDKSGGDKPWKDKSATEKSSEAAKDSDKKSEEKSSSTVEKLNADTKTSANSQAVVNGKSAAPDGANDSHKKWGENKWNERKTGDDAGKESGKWQRRSPPIPTDKIEPQEATVQIMDSRGNLSERKIKYGVSNRVQVEVIEGLEEGEKIVIGMKPTQKPNTANQSFGQPGGAAGGARQMR